MTLITLPNLEEADAAYERLIAAHSGLSDDASVQLNARLILLLMNHIGDLAVITQAIDCAVAKTETA